MRLRLLTALFALVSVLALTTLRTSAQDPAVASWANDLTPIAPIDWNYARAWLYDRLRTSVGQGD